ncbi:YhhA family cyclophane-containing RiPP [Mesorhizobium sp. M0578]|uniref:YhhA family cyclophane-containing RiPP n=1 Tax=unclassified Mesorhizobium TaxID=325217 RepID=UPI00333A38BD
MQVEKSGEQLGKSGGVAQTDVSLASIALARVIAEVRTGEDQPTMGSYNRTYNRHNR